MKTIEIKLYKFGELSEDAKYKALINLSDINIDCNWWLFTCKDAERIGLKITSFDLDRNKHAKGSFLLDACEVAQNVINEHGEESETYKYAEQFLKSWNPIFSDYISEKSGQYESEESEDKLIKLADDFLNYLLDDYANILQKESEYLQSDEAIIETIEANDYYFTENGKLY